MRCITLRRTKDQKVNGVPLISLPPRYDSVIRVALTDNEWSAYRDLFNMGRAAFQKLSQSESEVPNIKRSARDHHHECIY